MIIVRNKIRNENFNVSNSNIANYCIFLSKKESSKILNDVKNSYQDTFSNEDKLARKINNKEIYEIYNNNTLDFEEKDKESLNWLILNIIKRLPEKYRKPILNKKIGKLSNKLESGFPHTHKDTIFFSEDFCNQLNNYKHNGKIDDGLKYHGLTYIHECIHVWQREEPEKFNDLYKNYWNFKHGKIKNSESIINRIRKNPDGTDYNWIYCKNGKYIWPVALYNNSTPKNLGDVKNMGIYLNKIANTNAFEYKDNNSKRELRDISTFMDFFNIYDNNYHPNEISAELISQYYIFLMKVNTMDLAYPATKGLISWLNKKN